MAAPTDVLDAALTLAATFERYGVPDALGGAIAYGQYSRAMTASSERVQFDWQSRFP